MGFEGNHYAVFCENGSAGTMTAMVQRKKREYSFDVMLMIFHGASEHKINGKRYDLEMQLVHKQAITTLDRPYAILGVFFSVGERNPFL